jgi:very-short-patch-repair endonuclease
LSQLLKNAKSLRSNQTEAEKQLWYNLRAGRFLDLKFKRQKPIGTYIVDFVCLEQKMIIELDGGQHSTQLEYDTKRTEFFESQGYRVLRFWNNQVLQEMVGVLEVIRTQITLSPTPLP